MKKSINDGTTFLPSSSVFILSPIGRPGTKRGLALGRGAHEQEKEESEKEKRNPWMDEARREVEGEEKQRERERSGNEK